MKIKIACLEIKFSWKKKQDKKSETIDLQQSKCSIFNQKAKKVFDSVKKTVDINHKVQSI